MGEGKCGMFWFWFLAVFRVFLRPRDHASHGCSDASLHEVPVLDVVQFACGLRQLNQGDGGLAHWRTHEQHWLFITRTCWFICSSSFMFQTVGESPTKPRSKPKSTDASPNLFLQNNSAKLKFASATPRDMKITAISLTPICDSSAA